MKQDDLIRIKSFIRISLDIEKALDVSDTQKKILIKLIDLCDQNNKSIPVGDLAISMKNISERSFYRHIKNLYTIGLIKFSPHDIDGRVKLITPTPKLLKVLSSEI